MNAIKLKNSLKGPASWRLPLRILPFIVAYGLFRIFVLILQSLLDIEVGGFDQIRLGTNESINELITKRLPNTLLLLGAVLILTVLLAFLIVAISAQIRNIHKKPSGGKPWLFRPGNIFLISAVSLSPLVLGVILLLIFSVNLRWLPLGGMDNILGNQGLADRLWHLILPVCSMALMPLGIAVQISLSRVRGNADKGPRSRLVELSALLADLFRQTAGILAADVLIEALFGWPGLGGLVFQSTIMGDLPVLLACAVIFAGIILIGHLLAEFFSWTSEVLESEAIPATPQPIVQNKNHKARNIFFVVLLLIIIAIASYGMASGGKEIAFDDYGARLAFGGSWLFVLAILSSLLMVVLSLPLGMLINWLSGKGKWWAKLVSEILLLPANTALFLPSLLWLALVVAILNLRQGVSEIPWYQLGILTAAALQPRGIRFVIQSWTETPHSTIVKRIGIILSALFAGGVFYSFMIILGMAYIDVALLSSGSIVNIISAITVGQKAFPAALILLWFIPWVFYLAVDASMDDWEGKDSVAWLNS